MAKFISVFNNKGGVGKTTITWNVADALAQKGKRVLLLDFDPQCNLSIAVLGADNFKSIVSNAASPKSIRSFLQGYLQNTGPGHIHLYTGLHTHARVNIVPGDFWLNVYADSLSVGNDLLTGNGIAKFTSIRTLEAKLREDGREYDYVMIDLPPSFGGLVRSALYSSDYLVIPCTSDTFSEYCISLIGQMLPQFNADWQTGIARFKQNNYGSTEYDGLGKPVFAGWVFNGYDTRDLKMLRADQAHYANIDSANNKLASTITKSIQNYAPARAVGPEGYNIGKIEDMNVIMQNSLWQSVPAGNLAAFQQVSSLSGNKAKWSDAQFTLIDKIRSQIHTIADRFINVL